MNAPLLRALQAAAGEFVPFEALGPDQDAVRTDLAALVAFGFALERHPFRGVAYRGPATRLCPDQIEHELGTARVGRRVAVWNRVSSTNDLAARAGSSRANEGFVVLAEEQTAGRGSRGRTWTAPPGSSLLLSVLLFPGETLDDPAWLTALGAVAVAEVVERWGACRPAIKWPNDVRVQGRKVAGILVERGAGAVLGVGLNVNLAAEDLPADLQGRATSLRSIRGSGTLDRSEIARDLIRTLDRLYQESIDGGPAVLSADWSRRSEHLNQQVRVEAVGGTFFGELTGLDLVAGMTLRGPEGETQRVPPGQVLGVAPAVP